MNYLRRLLGDSHSNTALFDALKSKDKAKIEALLTTTDVNCLTYRQLSPLHFCILYGDEPLLGQLLDRRADVEHMAEDGFTPLMRAVYYNKAGMAKDLVAAGASVNRKGLRGSSALAVACFRGKRPLMDYLFWQGADVDAVEAAEDYKELIPAWAKEHLENLRRGKARLRILWVLERLPSHLPPCLVREALTLL